jgi:hypothetical protein
LAEPSVNRQKLKKIKKRLQPPPTPSAVFPDKLASALSTAASAVSRKETNKILKKILTFS